MNENFRIEDFVKERQKDPEAAGRNAMKRIAAINDMSGFGKCSLTVALPIISAMGIQCCPLPTSILSNQTGYPDFYCVDFTEHMRKYIDQWRRLDLHFDGIVSGFLGSLEQIQIVSEFIDEFRVSGTRVIVDPAMADGGRLYSTITTHMAKAMTDLVAKADTIKPNLTEACILTERRYREDMSMAELQSMAEQLSLLGPSQIVITGISSGSDLINLCYEKGQGFFEVKTPRIGGGRSGTGDIFSSILAGCAVKGVSFRESVETASRFISRSVARASELDIPLNDGVCFEEFLGDLG